MTIIQLRVLLALKELGNFTEVGEKLGITQSAVSHALASFEKEIGITLFNRDRKGVVLTEGGQRIIDHVREIVGRVERIKEEASSLSGLKIGKISVGTLQSAAIRIIPGLMGVMRQKYPGIEISVFEGTDQEVQDWIHSETVDLGILTAPCQNLETIPLLTDRMFGIVPEDHPLAGCKTLSLDQLSSEPIIRALGNCGMIVASRFSQAGLSPGFKTIEARNISTISAMVRSGAGSAILAGLAVPRDTTGIRVIPIEPPLFRQIVLAAPKLQALSPAARVFVDLTREWMAGRFQDLT
uniref:Transcriptional regulator, LysR family n=1 Tax=Leptospirillum ferrodiazotrophum TaxID=412449 RepID=C6HUD2_9BACT|nr:MAG: transcriptional regulator, LysR family [Leptospirillum ferrodiazotrophum]